MNDEMKKQINKIASMNFPISLGGKIVDMLPDEEPKKDSEENMERDAALLNNAAEAQEEEEIHHEG